MPASSVSASPTTLVRPLWIANALLVLLGLTSLPSSAIDLNGGLKDVAVAGTLTTALFAWYKGAGLGDCPDHEWRVRAQEGQDKELHFAAIGLADGRCNLTRVGHWQLSYSMTGSLGYWTADSDSLYHHRDLDLALVPMLRWSHAMTQALDWHLSLGIGPAWLNNPNIGDRQKSTQFQFSDQAGLGFGDAQERWSVEFAFRHLSNLDIKTPNNGANFKGIALEFKL